MTKTIDIKIDKAMFDMDWIFVNDRILCSITDAKLALSTKPWMLDKWLKHQKLQGVPKETFVQTLQQAVDNYVKD